MSNTAAPKPSYFAMSFPALNGEVVMQGHADYCAEHGHATHITKREDGTVAEVSPRCPRCGASVLAYFDMHKAWKIVVDYHNLHHTNYSPTRSEWTDAEVLAFAAEHGADGIETVFNR